MNTKHIYVIFLFLTINYLSLSQNVSNNDKVIFYWGAYGGLNINFHQTDFDKLEGYPNCCPKFTGGNGTGLDLGVLFEYPLQSKLNITARIGYNVLDADLKESQVIGNTELVSANPPFPTTDVVDAKSEYVIKSMLNIVYLEPGVDYNIFKGLLLSGGFRVGISLEGTFNQSETLVTPRDVIFKEEGSRVRNRFEGDKIPGLPGVLLHLYLGLGYKFPIGANSFIVPEIRYYQGLNKISSESWYASNLKLGAAVKFPVYESKEIKRIKEKEFQRDTLVKYIAGLDKQSIRLIASNEEVIYSMRDPQTEIEKTTVYETYLKEMPRAAELKANLITYGINAEGAVVENPVLTIEEIESEELFPILPYVFFFENSSDLKSSQLRLLNSSEAAQFKMDDLEWSTMNIYSQLLNIVGKRMRDNPSSRITLTGTNTNINSERQNLELSRNRAETVSKYLQEVWQISPQRITIQARNLPEAPGNVDRPEGIEENRRVEISSNNAEILRPVGMKDIIRKANPPTLFADPTVEAELDIDNWAITITQDGTKIREFTGSGKPQRARWDIEVEPIPTLEKPILVTLDVKDVSGQVATASDSREIKQLTIRKKRSEMHDDKRVEKYSLILFDYDKADIKGVNRTIVDEIRGKIEPNSKVTIIGYADRTGEPTYNRELAARRTAEVQRLLRVKPENLTIKNIGSDILLYDNNTPQGRSYCRTVQIIVETPVK